MLTANGESLRPSFNKMLAMAHVTDPERQARFHVLGCENVDGFDAVAKGEKVDVPRVTPVPALQPLTTCPSPYRSTCRASRRASSKSPRRRWRRTRRSERSCWSAPSCRRTPTRSAARSRCRCGATRRSRTGNARLLFVRPPLTAPVTAQVLDAITLVDFFHSAVTDNPVFGIDFHAVEEEVKVPPGTHDARLRPALSGSYSLGDAVAPRSYSVS